MRVALLLLVPCLLAAQESTGSLTGAVVDETGAYVPHATVELDSGTTKYRVQADDTGVYKFSSLPVGEYALRVQIPGFKTRIVKSIHLSEQNRILDIPLDVAILACGQPVNLDRILLPPGASFGSLKGAVEPPAAGIEVTLVCRTFSACKSTKTDFRGRFSFDMLSSGLYGLNFRREGFYPESATAYEYTVNAGWESVYSPVALERCPNGDCDPKLRPRRPPIVCE